MTNFIPVFPLKIVVFPGEVLNLHIFEPRYRQMILECIAGKKPFGIPSVMDKNLLADLGTLMEITELAKEYEDGSLDVRTQGKAVFRILEKIDELPEKMYSGAIVTYPQNMMTPGESSVSRKVLDEVKRLYTLMNVQEKFPEGRAMMSYEIAHYVGMTPEQEYELLGIFMELQRLEYIRRHLTTIVPMIAELENMKARIQRNGHFRNLSLE